MECNIDFSELFDKVTNKVIIISLEESVKRRENCIMQLENLSIKNYMFFPAKRPTKDEYLTYKLNAKNNNKVKCILSLGELGCLKSHYDVLTYAKNNFDTILILEDDFLLSNNFKNDFEEFVQNIPTKWDLIYLGKKQKKTPFTDTSNKKQYLYKPNNLTYGTHAILLNNKNNLFDSLLELYDTLSGPVDVLMAKLHQKFNYFAVINDIIITTLEDSIIRKSNEETYSRWGWNPDNYFKPS